MVVVEVNDGGDVKSPRIKTAYRFLADAGPRSVAAVQTGAD
jgi:hypothetical protein